MKIKLFQVDAFTDQVFRGNPAAVCVLDEWLSETVMQNIGAENNLAETAFVVKKGAGFEIRWFTPTVEVDLCGHATLAAAHVLFDDYNFQGEQIDFYSLKSGKLSVSGKDDLLTLDFPTDDIVKTECPEILRSAFTSNPTECYRGKTDFLLVFSKQSDIEECNPDLNLIKQVGGRGVIITAPGNGCDFVSRFFAPQSGIDEDPVTGSAHTTLTPYWSKKMNKTMLTAKQLSKRTGDLVCEYYGERVKITGRSVTYLKGEIEM